MDNIFKANKICAKCGKEVEKDFTIDVCGVLHQKNYCRKCIADAIAKYEIPEGKFQYAQAVASFKKFHKINVGFFNIADVHTKICPKCEKAFPRTNKYFSKNSQSKDGLSCYCKKCQSITSKKYRESRQTLLSPVSCEDSNNMAFISEANNLILKYKKIDSSLSVSFTVKSKNQSPVVFTF